jgi:hypothetical protein
VTFRLNIFLPLPIILRALISILAIYIYISWSLILSDSWACLFQSRHHDDFHARHHTDLQFHEYDRGFVTTLVFKHFANFISRTATSWSPFWSTYLCPDLSYYFWNSPYFVIVPMLVALITNLIYRSVITVSPQLCRPHVEICNQSLLTHHHSEIRHRPEV